MSVQALSQEHMQLEEQMAKVRQDIADALLEVDQIKLQTNPQIEADYAIKIGCWENQLFEAQIVALRAKRRFTLAQARFNRNEEISTDEIEATLDEEFEEWQQELEKRVAEYVARVEKRASSVPLSPVDTKELRDLHRELVKRLHPDLHPDQGENEKRLFLLAQGAFENGDLEMLRSEIGSWKIFFLQVQNLRPQLGHLCFLVPS